MCSLYVVECDDNPVGQTTATFVYRFERHKRPNRGWRISPKVKTPLEYDLAFDHRLPIVLRRSPETQEKGESNSNHR